MNTSLGYAKRTLTDTNVLLSGGGDKPLSNFISSISWDSTNKNISYTLANGTTGSITVYPSLSGGGGTVTNLNSLTNNKIYVHAGSSAVTGHPGGASYGTLLQLSNKDNPAAGTNDNWIALLDFIHSGSLYYRQSINTSVWQDWKRIYDDSYHPISYSELTGSGTTANLAIVSSGTANGWSLVTLGSNAFDSTSYLPLAGGVMSGHITLGTNNYIYGALESKGGMLFFNGSKTIVGSVGETTTAATHIRSITGHATIGTSTTGTYNILDSGNSSVSLSGLTLTVKINDVTKLLTNSTYSAFIKSGSGAAAGLVPKPSTTAGTTKFLCEDATWKTVESSHNHDDIYVAKEGDTMTGDLQLSVAKGTLVKVSNTSFYLSPIPGVLWHDIVAFCRVAVPDYYTSADGTNWTTAELNKKLFAQITKWNGTLVLSDSIKGSRWLWNTAGFSYSSATWVVIAPKYVSTLCKCDINFETSSDGETYTSMGSATNQSIGNYPVWFKISGTMQKYSRLTLLRNENSEEGSSLALCSIRVLTSRWGDQGQGSELEYPYDWDENGVLIPISTTNSGLGTSSKKWPSLYVTKINGVSVGSSPKFTDTWTAWEGATSSASGTAGYMPAATSADRLKYLRGDGSWIGLSPTISAGTSDTSKVKITVGGEESSEFSIPHAISAACLANYGVNSDPANAKYDVRTRWFAPINSTTLGALGYAGNNYGFPVSNNANGILWLGTNHYQNNNTWYTYGGLLGISSNGNIYYRFISANVFPTTANGGSWNKLAFLSECLPLSGGTMNDEAVISRSNTGASVLWVNGRNTPLIKTTSYTGYNPILSIKTSDGAWDFGAYSDNLVYLTYITDTDYNAGTNNRTYLLAFPKDTGTIALTKNIPSLNGYATQSWANGQFIKTTDTLFAIELTGTVLDGSDDVVNVSLGDSIGLYAGSCLVSFIDEDGINIAHSQSGIAPGTIGTLTDTSGSSLSVPYITVDQYGHITAAGTITHTVSGFLTSHAKGYGKVTPANSTAVTALTGNTTLVAASTSNEALKFSAANKWIVLAGSNSTAGNDELKVAHALNGITAGTVGTANATSGASLSVPYVTYDEAGHITATGTHTHTITGFATSNTLYYLTLNGETKGTASTTNLGTIYAPTSGGTSGQYLKSNGNSAPTWATFDFASSGHDHTLNIETTTDTSTVTLTANTKYKLTAGGKTIVFTTPTDLIGTGGVTSVTGTFWGNSWSNGNSLTGSIWAGTNTATSEHDIGVQTLIGKIYLYALEGTGSRTYKGLYATNSSGTDKNIILIATNNDTTFYGNLVGNADTATSATSATSSNYLSIKNNAYNSPSVGSLSYFTSNTSTVLANTNGIANPTNAYYYHLFMVLPDNNGYFCDVAWNLNPTPAGTTAPDMYFRIKLGSNYYGWVKVLTDKNHTTTEGTTATYSQVSSWTSGTNYKILFNSSVSDDGTISSVLYNNNFYVNSTGVYYSSDRKLKDNISKYHPYSELMDNPVRHFTWKNESDQLNVGFIAQEVEKWCPEAIGTSENGNKTVNYKTALTALCGIMYDRIQELEKEVKRLSLMVLS